MLFILLSCLVAGALNVSPAHAGLTLTVDTSALPVGAKRDLVLHLAPGTNVSGGGVTFEYDPADLAIDIVGIDYSSFGGPTQAVHMIRTEPGRIVFGVSRFQGDGYTAPTNERVAYLRFTRLTPDPVVLAVDQEFLGQPGGSSFTTLALDDIVIGAISDDSDGDVIPDWWEYLWFGNLATAGVGTDFDGDGTTDLQHYLDGTNPRIPFLITEPEIAGAAALVIGTRLALSFPTDPNAEYRLQRNSSLLSPFWTDVFFSLTPAGPAVSDVLIGTGGIDTLYLDLPSPTDQYFRLQLRE